MQPDTTSTHSYRYNEYTVPTTGTTDLWHGVEPCVRPRIGPQEWACVQVCAQTAMRMCARLHDSRSKVCAMCTVRLSLNRRHLAEVGQHSSPERRARRIEGQVRIDGEHELAPVGARTDAHAGGARTRTRTREQRGTHTDARRRTQKKESTGLFLPSLSSKPELTEWTWC